jgi:hypothetical protein
VLSGEDTDDALAGPDVVVGVASDSNKIARDLCS